MADYARKHNLKSPPNVVKVFFKYEPDHEIERISEQLESVIEDLGNTRDRQVMHEINHYPVLAVKAHTRPFEKPWLNVASAICLPLGAFFYCRMWRFRLRLYRDLQVVRNTNSSIANYVEKHLVGVSEKLNDMNHNGGGPPHGASSGWMRNTIGHRNEN